MSRRTKTEDQQLQLDFTSTLASKNSQVAEDMPQPQEKSLSVPLVYDPLNPSLTVLHRAGIAGLYLQIKAMEKLREDADDNQKENYIIPEHYLSEDGRILTVNLTEESFHSLMRERYQGKMVKRISTVKKNKAKKLSDVSEALKCGETFYSVFIQKIGDKGKEKFEYLVLRPAFNYFEVFNAPLAWQEHMQNSSWNSFLCIYQQQIFFKGYKNGEHVSRSDELWKSLMGEPYKDLKKHIYPNSQGEDLKGIEIQDTGKRGLLLHFWMIISTFFTPKGIEYKKSEKTKEMELVDQFSSPLVVVPSIINVEDFTTKFIQELGMLPEPKQGTNYIPEKFISTPLEAGLAFFAPRLAYYKVGDQTIGMRGAEVYSYARSGKQAIIREITYESIDEELVEKYKDLSKIKSFSYRALRVQNLIDNRKWHEGFERMVARYPPDLFIAVKSDDTRRFDRRALQMVQSIYYDFQFYSNKEKGMKNVSIETLIWRIVRNYVEWKACERAKIPEKGKHLKSKDYNKEVLDVTADLFINFRGRRDPTNFADAFCELFFRAPYYVSPEQMEQLHPFLSGDDWESGRRLVLMAISAAGALGNFNSSDNNDADSAEEDDVDFENDENSQDE